MHDLMQLHPGTLCSLASFAARYNDDSTFFLAFGLYELTRAGYDKRKRDIRFCTLTSLDIFGNPLF